MRTYLWSLLFWNVGTAAVTAFFSGLEGFPLRWLLNMLIGSVTGTVCYGGTWAVVLAEAALLERRGRDVPEHGNLWKFSVASLWLFPGLWLGFRAAKGAGALFGLALNTPDLSDYRVGVFFGVTVAGLFFLVETVHALRATREQAELRAQRAENERLRAQIAALTAQMNPHFLFNALNTIAAQARERPAEAEETTVALAELLRGVLAASRRDRHPLSEELALCRAYLDVEAMRFGGRLRASIEVEPGLDPARLEVPPLVVQPLVENAVKYAVAPRAAGGRVAVSVRRAPGGVVVSVEDDGPGMGASPAAAGAGSGLANCRARLDLHYGPRAALAVGGREGGGTAVRLTLPQEAAACAS